MATRVHLLAKELNLTSKDIIDKCKAEGITTAGGKALNHMSLLTAGLEATIREWFSESHGATAAEIAAPVPEATIAKVRKAAKGGKSADDGGGVAVAAPPGEETESSVRSAPDADGMAEPVSERAAPAPEPTTVRPAAAVAAPAAATAAPAPAPTVTATAAATPAPAPAPAAAAVAAPAKAPAAAEPAKDGKDKAAGPPAAPTAAPTTAPTAATEAVKPAAQAPAAPAAAAPAAPAAPVAGGSTPAPAAPATAVPTGAAAVAAAAAASAPAAPAAPTKPAATPSAPATATPVRPAASPPSAPAAAGLRPAASAPSAPAAGSAAPAPTGPRAPAAGLGTTIPGTARPGVTGTGSAPFGTGRPGPSAPPAGGSLGRPAAGAPAAGPLGRPGVGPSGPSTGGPGGPGGSGRPPLPPSAGAGAGRPGGPVGAPGRPGLAGPGVGAGGRTGAPLGAGGAAGTGAPPPPRKFVAAVPFVPAPAELKGPNVVRTEAPDILPAPRPRPAIGGGDFDDDRDGDRRGGGGGPGRSGPGRGGPGGPGGPSRPGTRRPATTNKRRSGRDELSQKIKEFTEADILELKDRLNAAKFSDLAPLGGKAGKKQHVPHRAVSALKQGTRQTVAVEIEEPISVKSLSAATGIQARDIIKRLMEGGQLVTVNSGITSESAEELAAGFNIELKIKRARTMSDTLLEEFRAREKGEPVLRAPVVTILGHVDHGKTSLLDSIRSANVAAGEAGGITQHIAAWKVNTPAGKEVVFIDTPGHQAFTAMRARGANMTDIAVLVVSPFDGGVMQTTVEAIDHAKAAKVPIVVALTKMDRPEVDENMVRKVYGQLAEQGLNPREWGGDIEVVRTSAMKKTGLDELLEVLSFTAETMDLKADPEAPASGRVIEARIDPERGRYATILVQDGTMVVGDTLLCGPAFGRVRAIFDDKGRSVDSAGPATPVSIIGLDEVPDAGEFFFVTDELARAQEAAAERKDNDHRKQLAALSGMSKPRSMVEFGKELDKGQLQELNIILRADVQGSVDALVESIKRLGSKEVAVKLIRAAVGGVTEADVELARASDAVIVGFNVVPEDAARKLAEHYGVEIRQYRIIYEILDDITRVLEGKLVPEKRQEILGHLEVRQVFKVSKVGTIAGCLCIDGKVTRAAKVRITRNNIVIADERELESLRRFKDDVREVAAGMECGMKVAGYDDVKEGDRIEAYQIIEVARKL